MPHLSLRGPHPPCRSRSSCTVSLVPGRPVLHPVRAPSPRLPEWRESIARDSREVRGTDTYPANIVVTPGAKPIMFYVLLALAEPGVEVIYPNPGFPIYESMIKFAGATPVPMQLLEEKDYHPDLSKLPGLITDKTRLIIINSPENP